MIFTKEELGILNLDALRRLAKYLDIEVYPRSKSSTIINKILERLAISPDTDFMPDIDYLLPGETLERPLYSARIRRIVKSKLEGDK